MELPLSNYAKMIRSLNTRNAGVPAGHVAILTYLHSIAKGKSTLLPPEMGLLVTSGGLASLPAEVQMGFLAFTWITSARLRYGPWPAMFNMSVGIV